MSIALLGMNTEWGGAQQHTVLLARALIERGHNTTVVCLTEKTYEFYRKRSHPQIPLICLPIPKVCWKMNFPDWARLFSRRTWNTCVLIKATFDTGDWILDLAVRYYFGNYLTIEHSMVDTIPSKTSRRDWGIFPGVGLWWYR